MTSSSFETFFFTGAMLAFVVAWVAGVVLVVRTKPIKWVTPFTGEALELANKGLADLLEELRTSRAGLVFKRAILVLALLTVATVATNALSWALSSTSGNPDPTASAGRDP